MTNPQQYVGTYIKDEQGSIMYIGSIQNGEYMIYLVVDGRIIEDSLQLTCQFDHLYKQLKQDKWTVVSHS